MAKIITPHGCGVNIEGLPKNSISFKSCFVVLPLDGGGWVGVK